MGLVDPRIWALGNRFGKNWFNCVGSHDFDGCIILLHHTQLRTMFANVIAKQMSSITLKQMTTASGYELTQLITQQPDLFPIPDYEKDSDTDFENSDVSGFTIV